MQLNIVTTSDIQSIDQQISEDSEQTEEQIKQKLELLKTQRINVFFKPILKDNNTNIKKTSIFNFIYRFIFISNKDFYERLEYANLSQLKVFLNKELKDLININVFYCKGRHVREINKLISRVKNAQANEKIDNQFRNIIYWLHKLIDLLKDFKYTHDEFPTQQIVSKEAITIRLDECIIELDKCFDGVGSRFAYEYEILSSIKQGLTGQIYLIRKNLYQISISKFIDEIKDDENYDYLYYYGNEIHLYNKIHNFMAEKLGFASIIDPSMLTVFPEELAKKFNNLATIDVSTAKITSVLAELMHEKLSECLKKIDLQDWLTTNKKDTDLNVNLNTLETLFFAPINMLFNVANEQKLTMNDILDTVDINGELEYSLFRSKENLHYWLANALMPNTANILIANIYDQQTQKYLSIASIDYMFFWVFEQNKYEDKITEWDFNDNHITLNLSHVQNLDFITFSGININHDATLFEHSREIEVSVALITQALEQTNNAIVIINFFANTDVCDMINSSELLGKKIYESFLKKLADDSFKQQFIDEIISYYYLDEKEVLIQNAVNVFIKYNIINTDDLLDLVKKGVNIKKLFDTHLDEFKFIEQHSEQLSADDLKNVITTGNRKNLFSYYIIDNNSELLYKLLKTNYYNDDINIIVSNNNTPLSVAIIEKNEDLLRLLLSLDNIQINANVLYQVFAYNNGEIYNIVITYIANNINKFDNQQLISLLEAKNSFGKPGIFEAYEHDNFALVKKYFEFILSIEKLNDKEKLFLLKVTDQDNLCWPFDDIKNLIAAKNIKEYIREYMRIISSFC